MRMSTDKDDAGYEEWRRAAADSYGRILVMLDGIEIKDVVLADEEAGLAVIFARDEKGDFIIDGDHIRREERHGVVQIVFAP